MRVGHKIWQKCCGKRSMFDHVGNGVEPSVINMVDIISSKYLEHYWIQTEGLSTDQNLRTMKVK
jgi:hypothetical protein